MAVCHVVVPLECIRTHAESNCLPSGREVPHHHHYRAVAAASLEWIYIYIYIERERERDVCVWFCAGWDRKLRNTIYHYMHTHPRQPPQPDPDHNKEPLLYMRKAQVSMLHLSRYIHPVLGKRPLLLLPSFCWFDHFLFHSQPAVSCAKHCALWCHTLAVVWTEASGFA